MAKEIPYFRFYPGEWFSGDITMLDMETRGVFVELCAYYWQKDCDIDLAKVMRRFSKYQANVNLLLEHAIFTLDSDENLVIQFLDEQYSRALDISRKRSKHGRSGGVAKGKQKVSKSKASDKYKDKDKDKDKYIVEIVEYLNFVTAKKFSPNTAETKKHISARLNDGYTVDDFKTVIDRKSDQWLNDGKMNRYLRPETLFNPTNFESYLNERDDLPEDGQERPETDEEKYETVKANFYAYWDKVGNLKSTLDHFGSSPYIKKIYAEIHKAGLKPTQIEKGPDAIPGLKELREKMKV